VANKRVQFTTVLLACPNFKADSNHTAHVFVFSTSHQLTQR